MRPTKKGFKNRQDTSLLGPPGLCDCSTLPPWIKALRNTRRKRASADSHGPKSDPPRPVHLGGSVREFLNHLPVRLPRAGLNGRPVEQVVKKGPEHAVGEAFIVPPDSLG